MKIIRPYCELLDDANSLDLLRRIEIAGRTCYKSDSKDSETSTRSFVARLVSAGHHSVIEHVNLTVRFVCDRGVSHELVRHRLASYSQESTRYANYSKNKFGNEITVIKPVFWEENSWEYAEWLKAMKQAENSYLLLLRSGAKPEEARNVLPNSLKTELIMTCNVREWRHILNLRCSDASHPQMRELMIPLLEMLYNVLPEVFKDIYDRYFFTKGVEEDVFTRQH